METTKIEPALNAEEWERADRCITAGSGVALGDREDRRTPRVTIRGGKLGVVDGWGESASAPLPIVIALANATLPDSDPRKITRGRIEEMKACSDEADSQTLYEIALALESYLPPV